MNRTRRLRLKRIMGQVEELTALMEQIKEDLQEVIDEEQGAYDNLPESIQCSDRGCQMEDCINLMQDAMDTLDQLYTDDVYSQLEEIVEG